MFVLLRVYSWTFLQIFIEISSCLTDQSKTYICTFSPLSHGVVSVCVCVCAEVFRLRSNMNAVFYLPMIFSLVVLVSSLPILNSHASPNAAAGTPLCRTCRAAASTRVPVTFYFRLQISILGCSFLRSIDELLELQLVS